MSNREQFDWEHRIKYLLKDSFSPKTFENYRREVARGLEDGRSFLKSMDEAIPSLDTIRTLHQYGFGRVYKIAGDFRAFGQEIAIGRDDSRGAYYSQIPDELNLLEKQMKELLEKAVSPEERARAITFYHLRYVKIHPFLDGNGRTGRVIFERQTEELLGRRRLRDYSHETYIEGIQNAFTAGDVSQLTKTMTGVELKRELVKTPYPLALGEIVVTKDVPGGKKLTIPCGEDVETAQEVEIAKLSPRLVDAIQKGKKIRLELQESTSTRNAVLDLVAPRTKAMAIGKEVER